ELVNQLLVKVIMIFKYVFKKILHLSIRVCFFNNKPTLQEQPTPENPSQTRPIPIEANQLAPDSDLADRQSTRHSPSEGQACWVPEGSGQAVPTTQPAPICYRGMLSYCGAFLSSFVLILSSPIQKIFLTLNLKQMLRLML